MEEECSDASKRRKIESTVLHILKASDLETATEFSVRSAAAVSLGFELSCLSHRRLVRQLIHSFLLSTAADILRTDSLHRINDRKNTDENADSDTTQPPQQPLSDVGVEMEANYNGKVICKLSDKRRVTIHDMSGTAMIAIRDFYIKDGNMLPKKGANSGLSLTSTQWSSFRNSFPSIQEAIFKLESESRPAAVPKLSECILTNSVADSASEKGQAEGGISNGRRVVFPPVKRMQNGTETDTRNSVRNSAAEKSQIHAGISNLGSTIPSHIKSKQTEADTSKAVISSNYHERIPVERRQEAAGTSLPASTVPPHVKTKQTEADTSKALIASNHQERIPVERSREAARSSFPVATSSHQETVSASRNETEFDIAPLGPLSPTQKQRGKHNAIHPQNLIPGERNQPEADISTSVPSFPSQWHLHSTANTIGREQLIPVQTTRFDGRNYHSWSHQMEFFLNQLNIAYVLSEPCPSLSFSPDEEKVKLKAATQRWIADDYICRHNILNSLCDNLFQIHSQKSCSARELWEELKFVYSEDFGTTRSQINKYIQFQMVDGVSVLEQVQELHRIANSVIASGTWIDETFHVSVIVSKLPPSWKELRFRLMQEEFLPLNMLMHCLRVEEESRYKKLTDSRKDHAIELKLDCRVGMKKHENRRACYSCGKEGHIFKNCPDRKSESCGKSYAKENGAVAPCTSAKIINAEKPS